MKYILLAVLAAFTIKTAFAVASFAQDQRAARLYLVEQGAR